MPERATGRHGAAVVVTDRERENFIVQIKDESYRVPELIGSISLIGGGIDPGETPRQTMERELDEEVLDGGAKEILRADLQEWGQFSLAGECRAIKYDYRLTVFVSELSKEDFAVVAAKVTALGGLTEGRAELLSRKTLSTLCSGPGHFAWGIQDVMGKYLKSHPQLQPAESAGSAES